MNHYEYLGEDSGDILGVAFAFQDAHGDVARTAAGWSKSASALNSSSMWQGDAANAAASDAKSLGGILADSSRTLDQVQGGLVDYANQLATLWSKVWDLNDAYLKQSTAITNASAAQRNAGEYEHQGYITAAEAAKERGQATTDITNAQKAITHLDELYAGYKRSQSNYAQDCITALTTIPGIKGFSYGGAGSTGALSSILGLGNLDVTAILQAEKSSTYLLSLKQPLDYTDPKVIAAIKALDAGLKAHSGDTNFTTPLLKNLGPHNLLQLTGELATMYSPSSAGWGKGGPAVPAIMSTVGDIQKQFGVALATSTAYLSTDANGEVVSNPPTGLDGLDGSWLAALKQAGESTFTFNTGVAGHTLSGDTKTVYGYVPLTVLMGDAGVPFSQPVLQGVGDDMRQMELANKDVLGDHGSLIWAPGGSAGVMSGEPQFNWDNPSGQPLNSGADPFHNWTTAMQNSPTAARAVLAGDNTLTNYLLNDRKWNMYTGSAADNPGGYVVVKPGDTQPSLSAFGDMLGNVDSDPSDPNGLKMMENVTNDLGSPDSNSNVKGNFASTNWIPDELRGGVATLVSHHLYEVNLTMNHSLNQLPQSNVQNVLQDLGKNEGAYTTLYRSEAATAGVTITNTLMHHGDATSEAAAYGSVNAYLDHGATSVWAQDKTDGAERHNALLEGGGEIFKIAASTATDAGLAATDTELAGPAADAAIDKVTDGILDQFKENPTPQINQHDIDQYANDGTNVNNNVTQAVYAAMSPAERAGIFGADPPPVGQLSDDQIDQVTERLGLGSQQYKVYSQTQTAAGQAYSVTWHALGH